MYRSPHFFVSPGDDPATITQYVAWMERQFNACQTPCSMYLSIFNTFRVIRCLIRCVSLKIAIFTTFLFPLGDAPGEITLNVVWMQKENSMLTNCLAAFAHLTITVSEIERYIGRKSSIFHTPFYSTPPLGGFPSEYRHPFWCGKTRMVSLPDGEKISKISSFVLAQLRNVTDRQTDGRTPGDGIYRAYA